MSDLRIGDDVFLHDPPSPLKTFRTTLSVGQEIGRVEALDGQTVLVRFPHHFRSLWLKPERLTRLDRDGKPKCGRP